MVLCLCWALWKSNSDCLSGSHRNNAVKGIASLLHSQAPIFTELRNPDPKGKQARKLARKTVAEAKIRAIPSSAVVCFSDAAGAGAHVSIPGKPPALLFAPLGHGTNNQGEMAAFLILLKFLDDEQVPPTHDVYVVTDSKLTQILNNARVKKNHQLVRDTRMAARPRLCHLFVILAPSHVEISLNEVADKLAKHAAACSAKWAYPSCPLTYQTFHEASCSNTVARRSSNY
jgi:ribonuclease HI